MTTKTTKTTTSPPLNDDQCREVDGVVVNMEKAKKGMWKRIGMNVESRNRLWKWMCIAKVFFFFVLTFELVNISLPPTYHHQSTPPSEQPILTSKHHLHYHQHQHQREQQSTLTPLHHHRQHPHQHQEQQSTSTL